MYTCHDILKMCVEKHASDIHLSVGVPVTCRIDGALQHIEGENLTPADITKVAEELLSEEHYAVLKSRGEVDFAHSEPTVGRFRINIFTQRSSFAISIRILNARIPKPSEVGIPQAVVDICDKKRGLVLVTGATGSGKSTTLASLINEINKRYNYHILTLEDPIEYLHRHNKSIVNQREVGSDTKSFPNALRAALRQDPDVIQVGEMRDLETISIAVSAAETGHLVFSTLHTMGASNTIDRIIDVFPPHQQQQIRTQLADVLECVVSQQLIPTVDNEGRVAAFEIMIANSAIRNHIREGKTFQIPTVIQTNGKNGMKTMDDALLELYQRGQISADSAISFAQDRAALRRRL